jgi:RNA polymerase sigma-70 factor (sigma-E family)
MFGLPAPSRDDEFAEFVRAATPSLSWTAYLLAGDRDLAAELLQEALARTYVAWRRVREGEATAYARRTLVNLNIDRLRRRPVVPLWSPDTVDPSNAERLVDDRDQLVRMLASLPVQQRQVIVLRYLDDLPEAEVAACLGVSVGAVKSAASRGMAALRQQYATTIEGER